jgi:acetyl-CoA carboxylase biotin carboxyl carrier protein
MMVATARATGEMIELASPSIGLFRRAVRTGDVIHGGSILGQLETLGRSIELAAPAGASGVVIALHAPQLARPAVGFGTTLLTIDPRGGVTAATLATGDPAAEISGLVFRAPTSGRFYGRSAPDKPPFVVAGTELGPGATICLLEVMKTFHRVTYGGLPERARVREVLAAEGADVNAGDPLLALDAL